MLPESHLPRDPWPIPKRRPVLPSCPLSAQRAAAGGTRAWHSEVSLVAKRRKGHVAVVTHALDITAGLGIPPFCRHKIKRGQAQQCAACLSSKQALPSCLGMVRSQSQKSVFLLLCVGHVLTCTRWHPPHVSISHRVPGKVTSKKSEGGWNRK